MLPKIKTLAKNTLLYALCSFIIRGGEAYIKILLQTQVLKPHEYGIITELYGSYLNFLGIIYLLSLDMAYFRFAIPLGQQYTFNTIITTILIIIIIFSTAIGLFVPQIAQVMQCNFPSHYFYYIIFIASLDTLLTILYAKLRVAQNTSQFISAKILQSLTHIALIALCFYLPKYRTALSCMVHKLFHSTIPFSNIDGLLIANICANIFVFGILWQNFKNFQWNFHYPTICKLASYSAFSFITTLCIRLHTIIPRFLFCRLIPETFYTTYTKEDMFGNIGFALKLTVLISLSIQAFKDAAEPLFFSNIKSNHTAQLYGNTMHLFIFIASMTLLLLSLNIHWIAKIIMPNPNYRHAIDLVPYLAFAQVLLGIYYNLSVPFKLHNKMQYNGLINLISCFVVGIASWLFMPKFGHWGYVYATLSGALSMVILSYYFGKKFYSIPYQCPFFLLLMATYALLSIMSSIPLQYTGSTQVKIYILLNIIILIAFGIMGITWRKLTLRTYKK